MKKLLLLPLLMIAFFCSGQNSSNEIIGTPHKLGKIMVAQNRFSIKMSWEAANQAARSLGEGWRLPTIDELKLMGKNKAKLNIDTSEMRLCYYWSANAQYDWSAFYFNFGCLCDGSADKIDKAFVRAVKSL